MFNKVTLIGRLGRDPEIRNTKDGLKIANMSIATSETWRDKRTGERAERTEWHRVVSFNDNLSDVIDKWCHKGQLVMVEGKLETRKWEDKDGVERYTTEIVLRFDAKFLILEWDKDGERDDDRSDDRDSKRDDDRGGGGGSRSSSGGGSRRSTREEIDDDIPF